jgi:cytochrome-b5 reductase
MAPVDVAPGSDPLAQAIAFLQQNYVLVLASLGVAVLLQLALLLRGRGGSKAFLGPDDYQPVPLAEKTFITHNTVRLLFTLPGGKSQRLGLPVGQHISFCAKDADGKDVYRSYTPTSDDDLLGAVQFVIKLYPLVRPHDGAPGHGGPAR